MDEQYQLQASWRYRRIEQAWYLKRIIHSLKTITTWNLLGFIHVMKFMVRMNWHCINLKIEYQDQCLGNTFQIALDLERRLFLHHNLDFLGLQLAWFGSPWVLGDIREKHKKFGRIWYDLEGFGKLGLNWPWTLEETWNCLKSVNNSICERFMRKVSPYYVYTRINWHSEISLKT